MLAALSARLPGGEFSMCTMPRSKTNSMPISSAFAWLARTTGVACLTAAASESSKTSSG
jgi:hypothetical protein